MPFASFGVPLTTKYASQGMENQTSLNIDQYKYVISFSYVWIFLLKAGGLERRHTFWTGESVVLVASMYCIYLQCELARCGAVGG